MSYVHAWFLSKGLWQVRQAPVRNSLGKPNPAFRLREA